MSVKKKKIAKRKKAAGFICSVCRSPKGSKSKKACCVSGVFTKEKGALRD